MVVAESAPPPRRVSLGGTRADRRMHELRVAVRVAPLSAKRVRSGIASVDTFPALNLYQNLPNIVFVQGAESAAR